MDKTAKANELRQAFSGIYGRDAVVYRAPGRVNLIGEHTDYNGGFVMPAAIDFCVWVAIAPRSDRKITVYSANFSESFAFGLDDPYPKPKGNWSDYPRGVALKLEAAGYRLRGADIVISSDVPIGAGLSSSAAIEVATGFALLDQEGISIDKVELAKICQQAENEFVGMRCGLMDQFISCFGEDGKALMLGCRSLEYKLLPMPADIDLVICNTMVKHELAGSEYNLRRSECEEGSRIIAETHPNVRALRDVTNAMLQSAKRKLPDPVYRRCRHVVNENERVINAAAALAAGEIRPFGELMYESHRSLRDDFEVSCSELDAMVELASDLEGVLGARMTGGGFGGCTINLVRRESTEEFTKSISREYEMRTGIHPEIYVCKSVGGVERVSESRIATADIRVGK